MSKIEKLELRHLAGYLPYGLKVEIVNHQSDYTGVRYSTINGFYPLYQRGDVNFNPDWHFTYIGGNTGKSFKEFKPLLRPLSDLTKEIEHNGKRFVPMERLIELYTSGDEDYELRFYQDGKYFYLYRNGIHCICPQGEMIEKLFEWHFNVHNLPDHLWVDINTVKV